MTEPISEPDWAYRNLLIIWTALLAYPFLVALCVYLIQPEIFNLDLSQPLIGERYIIVPAAAVLTGWDLVFSYRRHRRHLRQSIIDQNPELVKTALILACGSTASITVYGFLLWLLGYPYFYAWLLVGAVATILYFPRRFYLQAARGYGEFD